MMKIIKYGFAMFIGFMIAPKKGTDFRFDLANYLKRYRPQLQNFINIVEEIWVQTNENKIDELSTNIEYKIDKIDNLTNRILTGEKKVEVYDVLKTANKIGNKVINEVKSSQNAKLIAKEIAKIGVDIIDYVSDTKYETNIIIKKNAVKSKSSNPNKNNKAIKSKTNIKK